MPLWCIYYYSPNIQLQRTPLHLASCNGHISLVNFLLEKGANIEAVNEVWHQISLFECASIVASSCFRKVLHPCMALFGTDKPKSLSCCWKKELHPMWSMMCVQIKLYSSLQWFIRFLVQVYAFAWCCLDWKCNYWKNFAGERSCNRSGWRSVYKNCSF